MSRHESVTIVSAQSSRNRLSPAIYACCAAPSLPRRRANAATLLRLHTMPSSTTPSVRPECRRTAVRIWIAALPDPALLALQSTLPRTAQSRQQPVQSFILARASATRLHSAPARRPRSPKHFVDWLNPLPWTGRLALASATQTNPFRYLSARCNRLSAQQDPLLAALAAVPPLSRTTAFDQKLDQLFPRWNVSNRITGSNGSSQVPSTAYFQYSVQFTGIIHTTTSLSKNRFH